jgi:LemA protein
MTALIIVIVVVVVLALIIGVLYNGLVRLRQQTQEAWSDITVQLKRRADLIPNLVESVKGYAAHESGVFEAVTAARSQVVTATAQGPQATAAAENQFQGALKSLFAVSENYPDLKASQNFQQLQAELTDTEDKIQASRRFYNSATRDLNTKVQSFPSNILAGLFHFQQREYFEVADQAAVEAPVAVKF